MIIIADQIILYRKIHVLLLLFFCDVIFKFCIEHLEKNFWSHHCLYVDTFERNKIVLWFVVYLFGCLWFCHFMACGFLININNLNNSI